MTKTFEEIIKGIRKAVLGVEVREDIAQGMEYVEQFSTTATQKADEAASSAAEAKKASQDTEAAKDTAVSAINAAKSEATDEINTEKGEALNEISKSVSTAQDAAGTAAREAAAAAGSASNAAESEKNAKASADAAQEHQTGAEAAQKKAEDAADRAAATVSTDKTLTVENAPADAKAVGEALKNLNIRPATSTTLGGIKVGSGLSVTEDGILSADVQEYTLPAATENTIGGVKLSEDFTADADGTLHLAGGTAPDPYPVGIVISMVGDTSPAELFGGTWEEIAPDRVLMGASGSHAAGTTAEAGLPNITGSFPGASFNWEVGSTGAFTQTGGKETGDNYKGWFKFQKVSFDASRSSPVYGRSNTVQPAAYYVHIWHRVA